MDWQSIIAVVIVAGAAVYLLQGMWRSWRVGKSGCGSGGCGCKQNQTPRSESLIPSETIKLRQKTGEPL